VNWVRLILLFSVGGVLTVHHGSPFHWCFTVNNSADLTTKNSNEGCPYICISVVVLGPSSTFDFLHNISLHPRCIFVWCISACQRFISVIWTHHQQPGSRNFATHTATLLHTNFMGRVGYGWVKFTLVAFVDSGPESLLQVSNHPHAALLFSLQHLSGFNNHVLFPVCLSTFGWSGY